MLWVGLQMVCIGSLLVQTASVCLSQAEIQKRTSTLMGRLGNWNQVTEAQPERTCAKAAKATRGGTNSRSLSPWRYRLDQDQDRVPNEISIAECLCKGCIVNGREDHSYNSVPLKVQKLVYMRTKCKGEPNRYKLSRELIEVSVGCVCVTPKPAIMTNQQ